MKTHKNVKFSKFAELYLTLNKKERKSFFEFASLSKFRSSEDDKKAIKVLSTIKINKQTRIDKEIFDGLYSEENDNTIKSFEYVKSHLLKALTSFLKWQLIENSIEAELELLSYYQEKKALRNFESHSKKITKSLSAKPKKIAYTHTNFLYQQILLKEYENHYRDNVEIVLADKALDRHYLINKLRMNCMLFNEKRILNKTLQGELPIFSSSKIEESDNIIAKLYFYALEMLQYDKEEDFYYQRLHKLFNNNKEDLPKLVIKEIIAYLNNQSIRYTNRGKKEYCQYYVENIQYLIAHDLLLDFGTISNSSYKNTIASALVYKEYTWVENFIKTYTPCLKHSEKNKIELFHKALLHFHQNQIEDTLNIISEMEINGFHFRDHLYKIAYDKLLIKSYLRNETTIKAAVNRIPAFRKYVSTHKKLSQLTKKTALNFARIAIAIAKGEYIDAQNYKSYLTISDIIWLKKDYPDLVLNI